MKLYVASSWRNAYQPAVVQGLREQGHEVYDFRNPWLGNSGFKWSDCDPNWQEWDIHRYEVGLLHPIAQRGFRADFEAMHWADGCVLVMPSGRSAHLEAGWFSGRRKPVWVLIPEKAEPELMYLMTSGVFGDLESLCHSINRSTVSRLTEVGP